MNPLHKPPIIIICGPTGVGKTGTAIQLARGFQGEIISADSMQVYQQMDIGSAKPTPAEQQNVRHHLIDFIAPDQDFDAASFSEAAAKVIHQLCQRDVLSFVVGGTGLYIKSLLYGLSRARPANPDILEKLKREAELRGSATLHDRLRLCDPEAAQRIHPNDTFRIVRALEIWDATGQKLSTLQKEHGFRESHFAYLKFCLFLEREHLYERINRRVDEMLKEGFIEEVVQLRGRGYSAQLKSMQSIGYRHINQFLDGELTLDTALEQMKRDTRRYAKRQLTWFKADPEMIFVTPHETNKMTGLIERFLQSQAPD